jgi:probable HAF family extracellular repeat protein
MKRVKVEHWFLPSVKGVGCGAVVFLAGIQFTVAQSYKVFDLGAACMSGAGAYNGMDSMYALNDYGQVVGSTNNTTAGVEHAFLYSGGVMTDLGTLPGGYYSSGFGINNNGQVVGDAQVAGGNYHGFLYSSGTMTDLGTLPGGSSSYAYGINNNGQVVGQSGGQAFLYSGGTMTGLGTLPGGSGSCAYGINNNGQVVGWIPDVNGYGHAFLYGGGTMTDLGALFPGRHSYAYGIDDNGQVVGRASTLIGEDAFLYSGGAMMDLGTLPGGTASQAYGINNKGQVVGASNTTNVPNGYHAFLYSGGVMVDLNTLISTNSGWILDCAEAINNNGQIVALGNNIFFGGVDAFLLTPVPEPASMWLLALGSAALLLRKRH